jgi:branched-chain amino acid transport system permease protein
LSKASPGAIYGVILIVFMFLMPSGVAGGLRGFRARLATRAGATFGQHK